MTSGYNEFAGRLLKKIKVAYNIGKGEIMKHHRHTIVFFLGTLVSLGMFRTEIAEPGKPAVTVPRMEHREIAHDLFRALMIHLENYADPAATRKKGISGQFAAFMDLLSPRTRSSLVNAARRFSIQKKAGLEAFYGPFFSPTPQARLAKFPDLLRTFEARKTAFLRPRPILLRKSGATPPAPPAEDKRKKFAAPHSIRLELVLDMIRVNSMNDDDTPEDEIYLGVITFPGPAALQRYPGGDSYWSIKKYQEHAVNLNLAVYDSIQPGDEFAAIITVFEYDDGTWGEIWSQAIQIAQFAFEQWLNAETGAIATEIIMYFMDDLWNWIAAWFENPDDVIDTISISRLYEKEPKFWPPGRRIGYQELRMAAGADANYRFTFHWILSKVTLAK